MKNILLAAMLGAAVVGISGCSVTGDVAGTVYHARPVVPAPFVSGWGYTTGDPVLYPYSHYGAYDPYHPYYPNRTHVIYGPGWMGY
ncbi:MAG: hypothetical protein Kow0065_19500 [Methylomicrobium sp.]